MTATAQQLEYLKNSIKSIQDYPKPGILFRDVTSLLEDPKATLSASTCWLSVTKMPGVTKLSAPKRVASCLALPVALGLGVGFVPVRKPGKLPREALVKLTIWNTAPISWRSTLMPSNRATKFWWWTICWQPAALLKRPLN